MSSTQEIMWKGVKKDGNEALNALEMEIEIAVGREEGEDAAQEKKDEMWRRRQEWLKSDQAGKKARSQARGTKDTGLQY